MTGVPAALLCDPRTVRADDLPSLRALATAAFQTDEAQPFNDHSWSRLTEGRARVVLAMPRDGDDSAVEPLAGAVVLTEDEFELVVAPEARRRGLGLRLWNAAVAAGGRRVWSHGGLPAARALATARGAAPIRELLLLTLPPATLHELADGLDSASPERRHAAEHDVPAGLSLRMLRSDYDESAWLALNARAFAAHPEQGAITADDLSALQREDWYSPDDVLLLWHGETLVGFNWLKIAPGPDGDLEGEIYAIAVSPEHSGHGLGRVLMTHGLRHLARRVSEVSLYVEADNAPALALYRGLGFVERSRDIHWQVR